MKLDSKLANDLVEEADNISPKGNGVELVEQFIKNALPDTVLDKTIIEAIICGANIISGVVMIAYKNNFTLEHATVVSGKLFVDLLKLRKKYV